MTDKQLVKKCLRNADGAVDEFYNRYGSAMYGICLRYSKSRMDAEDILQEGFIKALTKLKEFRNEGPLGGWIRKIVINTAINFYRNKNSQFLNIDDVNYDNEDLDKDIISQLSVNELLGFIQELPEGYRMVFNMYVIEGYKHKEIAETLNITENTSKSQLAKARKHLQEKIKEVCYEKTV